ncbi:MAG: DUF2259 domain-containing protein [Bacteroidales bacterium]|nr:DUF2259 domain-containing protein [Bacteroidales bacterium]
MKKIFYFVLIFIAISGLFAGDKADFVNLGFSSVGKFFMFGNYGFNQNDSLSYSDFFIDDVSTNIFVPQGVFRGEYRNILSPGQSSIGALFTLLEDTISKRREYSIDHLNTGRPLYIRLNDNPESQENQEQEINALVFKDFLTGNHYNVQLNQTIEDNSSRFYIDLEVQTPEGLSKNHRIGHPNYSRQGIINYNINRIIINPDNSSLIIIIAKTDTSGNVRYMVETLKIF